MSSFPRKLVKWAKVFQFRHFDELIIFWDNILPHFVEAELVLVLAKPFPGHKLDIRHHSAKMSFVLNVKILSLSWQITKGWKSQQQQFIDFSLFPLYRAHEISSHFFRLLGKYTQQQQAYFNDLFSASNHAACIFKIFHIICFTSVQHFFLLCSQVDRHNCGFNDFKLIEI